jgi:hypothetical protein
VDRRQEGGAVVTRKPDKPPQIDAMRRRLEEAAQGQAEAMRTRKDTRSPGRLRGQRLLFETDEQGRLWGVQRKDVRK